MCSQIENWRLFDACQNDPFLNLAIDEAVLRFVGEGKSPDSFRTWVNTRAVVIGRNQSPELEINLHACTKYGVAVARRLSGGGAVYHDYGNLNFSVYLRQTHRLARDGVVEMFRNTGEAVASSVGELGISAEFTVPNTILHRGKKFSGMAAAVKWGAMLVHGTLLVESNLDILREVLDVSGFPRENERRYVRSAKAEVVNLQTCRSKVTIGEMRESLRTGFERYFGIKLSEEKIIEEESSLAEELSEMKYRRPEWILRALSEQPRQPPVAGLSVTGLGSYDPK